MLNQGLILSGYRCHDEDWSGAYVVLSVFIVVFFPFIVFHHRLHLEDKALQLKHLYIS